MPVLKKTLVVLVGGGLLLAGLAMLVLPGPAFVVIPAALAILAIEFVWARRWLVWLRERLKAVAPNKSSTVWTFRKPLAKWWRKPGAWQAGTAPVPRHDGLVRDGR